MPKASSILCFHPGALGDVINTLPALAALRRRWPKARLTGMGQLELMQLLAETGALDEARSLDFPGLHTLFHPELEPLPALVSFLKQHQLAVSWMRGPADIFPGRLQKLGLRALFHPGPFPPPAGAGPASRYYAALLKQLGIEIESEHPRLPITAEQRREWLSAYPELLGSPYLVIHPGSGSPRKNWPAENFAKAARELAARLRRTVVVVKGPADEAPVRKMVEAMKGAPARVLEGLTLRELAALLAGASAVIGNDSGVSHLAGAVGAPTIAVFVRSDPQVWGVNQPQARNLKENEVSVAGIGDEVLRLIASKGMKNQR